METKHLTWDAEKVGDFWNWYSLSAERRSGYFGNTYAKQMAAIAKRFNRRSADILDFGCGTGEVMSALETSGFIVSGCDSSENSVLACKKKLQEQPGFRDCVVSNDTAPFAKGSFDCVIATETIEHLLEEWIDGCFHTWHELLRDNGCLILTAPNRECLDAAMVRCPSCGSSFHRMQHLRSLAPDSISALGESRGFETIHCQELSLKTLAWNPLFRLLRSGYKRYRNAAGDPIVESNLLWVGRKVQPETAIT